MTTTVLVVEDDKITRDLVACILERDGYRVSLAEDGQQALLIADQDRPELVVLDLHLPGMGGLETCRKLRRRFWGSILVLSGDTREQVIVGALDSGADDYLTKPFRRSEFLARLRALHRRREQLASDNTVAVGDLSIDLARHKVYRLTAEVRLTKTEFSILGFLTRNLNRVVGVEEILDSVWGPSHGDYSQTLRVHIGHLRKKLERDPAHPRYVLTEPGVGYRLRSPDDAVRAAERLESTDREWYARPEPTNLRSPST